MVSRSQYAALACGGGLDSGAGSLGLSEGLAEARAHLALPQASRNSHIRLGSGERRAARAAAITANISFALNLHIGVPAV